MQLPEANPDPWYRRYARHVRLRQDHRALLSPSVRRDPEAALDFAREAAWYGRQVHSRRPSRDRQLIERLAAQISLPRSCESVSLIPVYVLERNLVRSFASYGEEPDGHCFLLWANAAAPGCDRARFERETAGLHAEVE